MSKLRNNVTKEALHISQEVGVTKLTPEAMERHEYLATNGSYKGVLKSQLSEVLSYEHEAVQNRIAKMKTDLPHLHDPVKKFYPWTREFFKSTNRINLLCAANQIGKSSGQIRKVIEWAGNPALWPSLWDSKPTQFWYFYPSQEVVDIEFTKKWVPEWLPRGAMKDHKTYGWQPLTDNGSISGIQFNSGVSLYFKTYGQKVLNLQTATVHYIAADEEFPEEFVDEILSRVRGTRGYFSQVFTATRGLPLWYRAMECRGQEEEAYPNAFKQTISMWDCQLYEDGTPSPWTTDRIKEEETQCTSKKEVLKRIYGRFVKDEGLRYEAFNAEKNVINQDGEPSGWKIYVGVDIGSGGKTALGHARSSASIVFLAVNPENTKGRVIRSWRGDNEETTSSDIFRKYIEMKGKTPVTQAIYDYASREFGLVASRLGAGFTVANKARTSGETTINLLFKSCALTIDAGVYHNQRLVTELMTVPGGEKKNRKYQDDLTDALKYVVAAVPWDFVNISPEVRDQQAKNKEDVREDIPDARWTAQEYTAWQIRQRRGDIAKTTDQNWEGFVEEIDAWNEAYGTG